MQFERTRVGNKALVTEDLVYLAEQRLRLRRTNPQNVGTTARFPFEHVERIEGNGRGLDCEREECREAVKEVKRSRKRLRGEIHDTETEVHALRACEKRRVWCRKVEGGVEIGNSGAESWMSLSKRYRQN